MITENLSTLKIHKLTKAQYERELAAGNIDANALYLTPDEEIDLSLYATIEQLATKANAAHSHSASEITDLQSKLDELSEETKSYTDTAVSGLASTSSVDTKINAHNTSTSAHGDIRELISGLSTDVINLQSSLDTKVPTSRTVNGKALSADIALSASDVGADANGSADTALSSAKTYTDEQVAQKTQVQIIRLGASD